MCVCDVHNEKLLFVILSYFILCGVMEGWGILSALLFIVMLAHLLILLNRLACLFDLHY